jgi:hypothetical protein
VHVGKLHNTNEGKKTTTTTTTKTLLAMLAAGILVTGAIFTVPPQQQAAFATNSSTVEVEVGEEEEGEYDVNYYKDDDDDDPECLDISDGDPETDEIAICIDPRHEEYDDEEEDVPDYEHPCDSAQFGCDEEPDPSNYDKPDTWINFVPDRN